MPRVSMLRVSELRAHELTQRERVEELKRSILREGVIRRPILVDERTLIVIDGHHRLQAIKELGFELIPAVLVDYRSDEICVEPWREGCEISKEEVIRAGLTGKPLPPKTSRHFVICGGCKRHVEYLEGEHPIPLSALNAHPLRGSPRARITGF